MAVDRSLVSGSTTMLLLKLLSEKDMYGYEMIETLREKTQNVIELKAGKDRSEAQLEDLANVALQQINDRAYSVDLQAMNVTSIIKIGIAFSGKRTRIAAERQNIE